MEGLLMSNPAVILHKGQKLVVESDTTEIFEALKAGKLEEVKESGKNDSKTVKDTGKVESVDADKDAPEDAGKNEVSPEPEDTASKKKSTGKKSRTAKGSDEKVVEPFL